jgi:hypothetical protein
VIHVDLQPEPEDFDARVRQPGLRAVAEEVKELPPYWRACLPAMRERYRGICAYLCVYVPRATGAASVDHLAPKSKRRELAYEWSNYRFVCSLMNARKRDFEDVLDPMEIPDGWFILELSFVQVLPNPELDAPTRARMQATIDRLKLNDEECRAARAEDLDWYWAGRMAFEMLEERSPFVARELRRQGLVLDG